MTVSKQDWKNLIKSSLAQSQGHFKKVTPDVRRQQKFEELVNQAKRIVEES